MLIDLGVIDYEKCYAIQKNLVEKRRFGEITDSVIIAEHQNIYTIGRTGRIENVLAANEILASRGIKVLRVDRGGDVTYHGPGQLVVYPIVDLKVRQNDLHRYLRSLEEIVIRFLKDYDVLSGRLKDKTGVWVRGKKIASVGVGASNWVTFHGLSVNINCDLKFFSMINPCGMKDVEMTSLERLKGREIDMREAKGRMLRHCEEVIASVFTDEAIPKVATARRSNDARINKETALA
ncbi:MAG: lipoyl(octanoyl) transferase LipB [Candidatus Omnitrophota bacterium]|nr:lipoyl(octanoyl) transferase LipB [Candidatus Omnitrophota bacterium]